MPILQLIVIFTTCYTDVHKIHLFLLWRFIKTECLPWYVLQAGTLLSLLTEKNTLLDLNSSFKNINQKVSLKSMFYQLDKLVNMSGSST